MQLAAIKLFQHCYAQGFFGFSATSSPARLQLLESQCSSSRPLGLQVASLMKEKTLKAVFLTRQLKEKNPHSLQCDLPSSSRQDCAL